MLKFGLYIKRSIIACFILGTSTLANADLVNQEVFGILNLDGETLNLFNPENVSLPQDALNEVSNPVSISDSELEFAYALNGVNGVFVDFTDKGFTLTNDVVAPPYSSWEIELTSAVFSGLSLNKLSDSFNNSGIEYSINDDTILLSWGGTDSGPISGVAEFSLEAEPQNDASAGSFSITLLAILLLLVFSARQQKYS